MGPRRGILGQAPNGAPRALMSLPIAPPKGLLPTPNAPLQPGPGDGGPDDHLSKAQREALLGAVSQVEKKIESRSQPKPVEDLAGADSFNSAGSFFGADSNPFRRDADASDEPPFKKLRDESSPNDSGKSGGDEKGKLVILHFEWNLVRNF